MTDMDLLHCSAMEIADKINKKELSVQAVLDASYGAAEKQADVNAFISLDRAYADRQGKLVQERIDAGEFLPLAGVPVAIKDNICVEGLPATCGSRMLADFAPCYDAEAVKRLKAAGAIIVGKTNMDEFGMGSTTENSYFGPTLHPMDKTRVPGGSSGGSAAALAMGACTLALGSDTGGSVRQPASYCGLVGMKPTYGTVSRFGLVSYASSLEQIGPMGKCVRDVAHLLDVIAGSDGRDVSCIGGRDMPFSESLIRDAEGMRIAVPEDFLTDLPGVQPAVKAAVERGAKLFSEHGAVVEYVRFPRMKNEETILRYAVPAYYTIADAEASSNLARFDGVKYGYRSAGAGNLREQYEKSRGEGFGDEVKRRIMLGTYVLSAGFYEDYYRQASRVRRMIRDTFDELFEHYDFILGPVAPTTAPVLHSRSSFMDQYPADIYTIFANLTGMPAITVPLGQDENGLPVGVQLMANVFCDASLLQAAYSLEAYANE